MALRNRGMVVEMDQSEHGDAGEYTVQVRLGDQMRAELECKKMGLSAVEAPIHLQGLSCWAAMVREGHFSGNAKTFRDACVFTSSDKASDADVDPTDQGQLSD